MLVACHVEMGTRAHGLSFLSVRGESPIFFAPTSKLANMLVRAGASVDARNKDGVTPLMYQLVRWGSHSPTPAQVRRDNTDGGIQVSLMIRVCPWQIEVVECLMKHGAKRAAADPQQSWTALHVAAHNNNLAVRSLPLWPSLLLVPSLLSLCLMMHSGRH